MIIPLGYAQANFIYDGQNLPNGAEWTLGFDLDTAPATPALMAADLATAYQSAAIQSLQVTEVRLVEVLVKWGTNATGPSGSAAVAITGTGGGDTTGPQSAILVQKNTNAGGRAGRGRFYLPGVPDGSMAISGNMNAAERIAAQSVMDDFYADLISAGLPPVLLHGVGSPISTPTPITSFTVAATTATQRRRLRG